MCKSKRPKNGVRAQKIGPRPKFKIRIDQFSPKSLRGHTCQISWSSDFKLRRLSGNTQTDRHTDRHTHTHRERESDYCGHPFRVSGVFSSTYQGSTQQRSWNLNIRKIFSPEIFRSRDLRTPNVCVCVCLSVCLCVCHKRFKELIH